MSEWIAWNGGNCPVPNKTRGKLRLRDGYVWPQDSRLDGCQWKHEGLPSDIIAYKLADADENTITGDSTQATTFGELAPRATPVMDALAGVGQVGDVNSTAKGSGARYNADKIPLDLIPLTILSDAYLSRQDLSEEQFRAARCLQHLGDYQSRARGTEALYAALLALGSLPDVLRECAQVFDYGRRKYAEWNWAKGMKWSIPFGCAARHALFGILAGEHNDPESGLPHRGHIACNIVMLISYAETFTEGDDRPAAGLLAQAVANDAQEQAAA